MDTGDTCEYVPFKDKHSDPEIKGVLERYKVICVVGASDISGKAAHDVPEYLISKGYNVIPVNPNHAEVFGVKAYKSIGEVRGNVDVVEIFRPSEEVYGIVSEAIKKHPKVIWMQEGIYNKDAVELAEKEGIFTVFNRCMFKEHVRLFGD
ncbi:MAG: CoA-binding protein [Candidatus Parvarchaeota archaeon]|nr:CoA-binding protein [Candidatus Parvarchaeota archaeon]